MAGWKEERKLEMNLVEKRELQKYYYEELAQVDDAIDRAVDMVDKKIDKLHLSKKKELKLSLGIIWLFKLARRKGYLEGNVHRITPKVETNFLSFVKSEKPEMLKKGK